MPWLKRNLALVISGVVALGLLGVAGFYLYSNWSREQQATMQLEEQTTVLTDLVNRPVHPGTDEIDNITATKKQAERIRTEVLAPSQKYFQPIPIPEDLDSARFSEFLANTIFQLRQEAERASVKLRPQYSFSFAEQERSTQVAPEALKPLAQQLVEVKTLCRVLFEAKIHELMFVQRAAVSTNEPVQSEDYLTLKITTNEVTGAVISPYELGFVAFSTELAAILETFAKLPHGIAVKFIEVRKANLEPDPAELAAEQPATVYRAGPTSFGGMDPALAQRYGLAPPGGRYGGGMDRYGMGRRYGSGMDPRYGRPMYPPPGYAPTVNTNRPPGVFLDEEPLEIVLALELIKFQPTAETKLTGP